MTTIDRSRSGEAGVDQDQEQTLTRLRRRILAESADVQSLRATLDSLEAQGRPPRRPFFEDATFFAGMVLSFPAIIAVVMVIERLGR